MFYKYDNGQLLSGEIITTPNAVLSVSTDAPHDGWFWFDSEELATAFFEQRLNLENNLIAFAAQKDIDIAEIAMLLNSENAEWKAEAEHFQALYLASWEAFYNNESLPELAW